MWRLGLQRFGMSNPYLGYIMVLTHKGRKSGLASVMATSSCC